MRGRPAPGVRTRSPLQAMDVALLGAVLAPWILLGLIGPDRGDHIIGAVAAAALFLVVAAVGVRAIKTRMRHRGG